MECEHVVIDDESGIQYCSLCGEESVQLQYAGCVSLNSELYLNEISRLLYDVTDSIKTEINKLSDVIFSLTNLRGKRKRAITGICYMYVNMKYSIYYTSSDIIEKFGIDKKKFYFATKYFLKQFPQYRTVSLRPENFVDRILLIFKESKELDIKQKVTDLCINSVLRTPRLLNFNPYNVCACITYKYFLSACTKRGSFIKTAKISDSSMQKILPLI